MIAEDRINELMSEAITEAGKSKAEDKGIHPKVGAILVDSEGVVIERAHRGMEGHGDHAEFLLLKKARAAGHNLSNATLFVTLEPCAAPRGRGKLACAEHILQSGIRTVYIGMLDPNPQICGRGETLLRYNTTVERFPAKLVKQIEQINSDFVQMHRAAHLSPSSLYVATQISDLIRDYLVRNGRDVEDLPFDWDVTIEDLEQYCYSAPTRKSQSNLHGLVHAARGYAFDKKYSDYNYGKDVRGMADTWQHELRDVLRVMRAEDYSQRRVLNIGIGNGLEAKGVFDSVAHLTAVDIAETSLEKARAHLPKAKMICEDAEDLKSIMTGSQDIYVSLRTFQSSYFGVTRALQEAYRVVRQGGIVLISIANGFLTEESGVVPGLVIPRSNVVSRDRPFEVAEKIRKKLTLMRFEEVGVRTGFYEIYVYGRRAR
jgi:pyrimidine deaminase RibD-like protein/SAM-dependent methyltransferase